jgi:hypothetical protein
MTITQKIENRILLIAFFTFSSSHHESTIWNHPRITYNIEMNEAITTTRAIRKGSKASTSYA